MNDNALTIAIFSDHENIAIGLRDANFTFDINMILERLLEKGNILVKQAYADWERYRPSCRPLHEAGFELIEIPHVSYSGKNSADIHMVVDALDLCYTRPHIDTFVILSGDSDFSPLVRKLRVNNKKVIGMGVKNSSSNLLIESCDEFIYYDDLVRRLKGNKHKKSSRRGQNGRNGKITSEQQNAANALLKSSGEENKSTPSNENTKLGNKEEALDFVLNTTEALFAQRDGNLWGSMVKQTLKRKRPNFDETYYGYRTFNNLLKDAQERGLLDIQKDEKSGGFIIVGFGPLA
jgi:uncharacterized protein (TIGR00288 family)